MSAQQCNSISAEIHRAELETANGKSPTKNVDKEMNVDQNDSTNLIDNSINTDTLNGDRILTSSPLAHGKTISFSVFLFHRNNSSYINI